MRLKLDSFINICDIVHGSNLVIENTGVHHSHRQEDDRDLVVRRNQLCSQTPPPPGGI